MIFKIGNEDFTTCVVAESYAINDVDVYETWQDANYNIHREKVRSRVSGNLTLHLRDDADLERWHTVWNSVVNSCRYSVTCSINNTGEEKPIIVFLDCTPARKSVGNRDTLADFELTVTEV